MVKFIKEHQISVILFVLYVCLKGASVFVTAEMEFWYATLHGHSDDVLGALLIVTLMRRPFREKGYQSEKDE